ncbi:MAG: DUF692 family protein [Thermaerobacter sp.]|nr:DUF692 family protein [Thermaerobacter sp.]
MDDPARLGANYSPQLMELLQEEPRRVDFLKLSREETVEEDVGAAGERTFLLHWNLTLGQRPDWERWLPWLRRFEVPWVNIHFIGRDARPQRDIVAELSALVQATGEHLGMETAVLVENAPYYGELLPGRCNREFARLDFLRDCAEAAGARILLDLAHARVSAATLGVDVREHIRPLQGAQVVEIHTTGPAPDPDRGFLRDRHLEMGEADYDLLRFALPVHRPRAVTLEYGGTGPKFVWRSDKLALKRQLRCLRGLLCSVG